MTFLNKLGGVSNTTPTESFQVATLHVSGMRCAGCVQSVEQELLRQQGVTSATVNLMTQNAQIEYQSSIIAPEHLAHILTDAGFKSQVILPEQRTSSEIEPPQSSELRPLALAIALVFFSFVGHLQDFFPIQFPVIGTMAFHFTLATLALLGPGRSMIVEGSKALLRNQPTMDTLVSMGSVMSYGVSVVALMFPGLGWDCFFDATVMIIGLILLGRTLETQAKTKAKSSFHALLSLQTPVAYRLLEGSNHGESDHLKPQDVETIAIERVMPGDRLQVLLGDHFPVDGVILKGQTLVDESMLTGESLPVAKEAGDPVTAGTLNQHKSVVIKATRTGAETTLAQITRLVEEAQTRKAPIQTVADTVAGYFAYGVMAIALLTFLFWWAWGAQHWPEVLHTSSAMHHMNMLEMQGESKLQGSSLLVGLKFSITVLVIACPCALGLATPTALLVGTSMGAERGLLLRGGDVLERCSQLTSIVFDKTGTLTTGKFQVTDFVLSHQPHPLIQSEDDLIKWMASVEQANRHPLANAILAYAQADELFPIQAIELVAGYGVAATYQNHGIKVGTRKWLAQDHIWVPADEQDMAETWMAQGKTVIYCAIDQQFAGAVALQDTLRQDAQQTFNALQKLGLSIHVLTGDRLENTQVLLQDLALPADQVVTNLSPREKAERLRAIQTLGPVAMVGDGINDAPALAQADVGIALSSGTDVAIETAQIVLTRSQFQNDQIQLNDIVHALRLSQATFKKIKQNLFWAFTYNIVGIPLAAGLLFPIFHLTLSPAAAAALMAISSVSVISNSLLLQTQWRSIGQVES